MIGAHLLRGVGIGASPRRLEWVVIAVAVLILIVVLVGLRVAVVAEVECRREIMHEVGRTGLVTRLPCSTCRARVPSCLPAQDRQRLDHLVASRGGRQPGQALAHQHRERIRARHRRDRDLVELAAMEMVVELAVRLLATPAFARRPIAFHQRLATPPSNSAERLWICWHPLAVELEI